MTLLDFGTRLALAFSTSCIVIIHHRLRHHRLEERILGHHRENGFRRFSASSVRFCSRVRFRRSSMALSARKSAPRSPTYLTDKMQVIAGEITPTTIRAAVDNAFPTFPEFLRDWIAGAISPDLIDNSLASLVNSIQPAIKSSRVARHQLHRLVLWVDHRVLPAQDIGSHDHEFANHQTDR
ncbi:MAG: hypothetical protein MZU97_00935 [Bacillus subtilis]|nr:hypothetical protein [Bacillus subtilis]